MEFFSCKMTKKLLGKPVSKSVESRFIIFGMKLVFNSKKKPKAYPVHWNW